MLVNVCECCGKEYNPDKASNICNKCYEKGVEVNGEPYIYEKWHITADDIDFTTLSDPKQDVKDYAERQVERMEADMECWNGFFKVLAGNNTVRVGE